MRERMNAESRVFSRFDLSVRRTLSPATLTFSSVRSLIKDFERRTPTDRLVCAFFSVYPNVPLIIKSVGFTEPDLIVFWCQTNSAVETNVVLDISQLNLALSSVPALDNLPARRPIGFELAERVRR